MKLWVHIGVSKLLIYFATAYYLDINNEKQMKYYILCSDDLVHDENSIYFHNKQIRVNLHQKGVTTQDIHVWSDGPSS